MQLWRTAARILQQASDAAAALTIQRVWRGHRKRLRCAALRRAATAACRGCKHKRQVAAATQLQALWRGVSARKQCTGLQYSLLATLVQVNSMLSLHH
jgi:IQ calmodulin-binding motif